MRRGYWKLALLLLLFALAGGVDRASAEVTPRTAAAYEAAVAWWGAAPSGDRCVYGFELREAPMVTMHDLGPTTMGEGGPCLVVIAEEMRAFPRCQLYGLLRHEVGHALGHEHTTDGSIMDAYTGSDTPPPWQTLVCDEWRARWRQLHHVHRGDSIDGRVAARGSTPRRPIRNHAEATKGQTR